MIQPGDIVREAATGTIAAVHHLHSLDGTDVAYLVPLVPGECRYAPLADLRRIGHVEGYGADEDDYDEVAELYVDTLEQGANVGLFVVEPEE